MPATLPSPPSALAQAPHGLAASQLSISQAWAKAWRWPPPAALPRARAICWPTAFMNSMPPCTFSVPKSAYCWPLMALSAAGPCVLLSTLNAFSTVLRSPVADALT